MTSARTGTRAIRRLTVSTAIALAVAGSIPLAAAPAPSQAAAASAGDLTIDRLYALPRIIGTAPAGFAWSPDSRRLAFLWNDEGTDFRDVWIADVASGRPHRATRLPRSGAPEGAGVDAVAWFPDGDHLLVTWRQQFHRLRPGSPPQPLGFGGSRARFSPDGAWLTFLRGGDLWITPAGDDGVGEPRRLTAVAGEGIGVGRYSWSPDSRGLAVVVRDRSAVRQRSIPDYLAEETTVDRVRRALPGEEPGRTRLALVALDGTSRPIDLGGGDRDLLFSLDWSAAGDRLLVDTSDLYVKERRLLAVEVASGERTLLVRETDPGNVMAFWQAAWSPDGRSALFLSDRDGFYHLYAVAGAGGDAVALTRGPWAVESFHATAAEIFLVTNRSHPSQRQIDRVTGTGGVPERVSERVGTHAPTFAPDGRWAAVRFSSDATPPDLFLNRLSERGETRVTDSPLAAFHEQEWIVPEYVTFPSHVDGTLIHGRLMLPPGFDPAHRYPAIIGSVYSNTLRNQWGGRTAHPLWGLDQVLLRRGYVLMNVNVRGSWGLGRDVRRRMQRDYGGIDTEDIYSGVRYLESRGFVDMARVGVWGSSYGGLMTAMSLFKRPGVFAAGVAGAPATNVWHATTGEMRVMGRPQDQPEAYERASALSWAAGLEDPLMIIHGMRDRIVFFKDSLALLQRLIDLDKAHLVELVPLPDSRHGWDLGPLPQTRFAFRKLIDHFDRHLRPGPAVAAHAAEGTSGHEAGAQEVEARATGNAAPEPVDLAVVARIRDEGLRRSRLADTLSYMTDVLGGRLTLSDDMSRAQAWAVEHMRSIGLENVEIEPFMDYGVRWDNDYVSLHLLEPDYQPMVGYPLAHTPGTDGRLTLRVVRADVRTRGELAALHGRLEGVAVLSTPAARIDLARLNAGTPRRTDAELRDLAGAAPTAPARPRPTPDPQLLTEVERLAFYRDEGVAVVLESRSGWPGAVRGFARPGTKVDMWARQESLDSPPIVAITPEHYNRLIRLADRGIETIIEVEVRNRIGERREQAGNVLGDIPGSDLAHELVMLGAHFDTWHASPNASDNTSGVAVMLEAARILRALQLQPRRTIRVALWSGEEQGIFGSRAYVARHFGDPGDPEVGTRPAHEAFSVYFNQDYGPGRYRGIYLHGNERVRSIFAAWMEPFRDLGMTTIAPGGVGSTDHVAFDAAGLPGFQFLQDRAGSTGGHTNLDFYDTLPIDDLVANAVIVAAFVYHAAMRDERIPRRAPSR